MPVPNQDWSCLCLVGKSFRIILTQPRWGCLVWRQFHLSPSSGGQLFCSQTPAPISLCKSREFSICNWKDFCHLGLLCRPVKTWEKLSFGVESWTGAPKRQIWEAILQDIFNLLLNAKNCIFKNVAVFYAFRNASKKMSSRLSRAWWTSWQPSVTLERGRHEGLTLTLSSPEKNTWHAIHPNLVW